MLFGDSFIFAFLFRSGKWLLGATSGSQEECSCLRSGRHGRCCPVGAGLSVENTAGEGPAVSQPTRNEEEASLVDGALAAGEGVRGGS